MNKRSKFGELIYQAAIILASFGWFGMIVMLADDTVSRGWRWIAATLIAGSVTIFYYDHEYIDKLEKEKKLEIEKKSFLATFQKRNK